MRASLPCDPLRFSPRPPIHTHHCVQHNTHKKTCHAFPGPHRESPHDALSPPAASSWQPATRAHAPHTPSSPLAAVSRCRRRSSGSACRQPQQCQPAKAGGGHSPEGNLAGLPATVLPCTATPTVTRARLPACHQSLAHPHGGGTVLHSQYTATQ